MKTGRWILVAFSLYFAVGSSVLAQSPAKEFLSVVGVLANQGKWSDVEGIARERIKVAPKDPKGWEILGVALGSLKRPGESLSSFEKAYSLNSSDPSICMNLGIAYAKNSKQAELVNFLKTFRRENINVPVRLLDRDEVFEAINTDHIPSISDERKSKVLFPAMGPFPALITGKSWNNDVLVNGAAVFEAFVSPDGLITKCNGLAGLSGHVTASKSFVEKIRFPKLESTRGSEIQRVRVVMYFDVGQGGTDDNKYLKVHRMGIGFHSQEAVSNAIEVTEAGSTPRFK